jgi:replication factor C subunit 3/5
MVMELNASDDRGIEIVRSKIKQFVISQNVFFGKTTKDREHIFKLVILDETDAMTSDAQAILRKIIEKYTNNTRFCLICNYIQNISQALQSRCTRFRFSPIDNANVKEKILHIANQENINVEESGINTIIKRSSGDMRKAINLLQSVSMSYSIVNEKNVNICYGYPRQKHMNKIIISLLSDNYINIYDTITNIKNTYGLSLDDIIMEIHDILIKYIVNPNENLIEPLKKINIETMKCILDKLRIIEFNQSVNTIENIQISGLIGVFKLYL